MIAQVILFIVFVGSVYYLVHPFIAGTVSEKDYLTDLESTKADEIYKINLLKQIREVEFENEMGIISKEDFIRTRNDLMLEIKSLKTENRKVEKSAKPKLRKQNVCPKCANTIAIADNFCPNCGTAIKKKCGNCGKALNPEDKFCSGCGTPAKS